MKRRSQLSACINYGVEIIVREIPVKQFANPVAFSHKHWRISDPAWTKWTGGSVPEARLTASMVSSTEDPFPYPQFSTSLFPPARRYLVLRTRLVAHVDLVPHPRSARRRVILAERL